MAATCHQLALGGFLRRARRKIQRTKLSSHKRTYQMIHRSRSGPEKVLLILGCQRSGTTLLLNVFAEDLRTITFGEESVLTVPTEKLRLKPIGEVNDHVTRLGVPLVVLKPLVESQNAPTLLGRLRNSAAIWMYRKFDDVAASDLDHFGIQNGKRNLRLLLFNDPPNWRGEVVPDDTRAVLNSFYTPDISPYDAAALFWWSRNALFFQLGLDRRDDVFLCSYEALVTNPDMMMHSIYGFLNMDEPRRSVTKHIHAGAVNHGKDAPISSRVRDVCQDLYERLEACSAL